MTDHVRAQSPTSRRLVVALALAGAAAATSGCYERVTKAKGLGADSVAVSEPYQETSKLDDWLFGKEEKKSKSLLDR